jgi:hypothetical protein
VVRVNDVVALLEGALDRNELFLVEGDGFLLYS